MNALQVQIPFSCQCALLAVFYFKRLLRCCRASLSVMVKSTKHAASPKSLAEPVKRVRKSPKQEKAKRSQTERRDAAMAVDRIITDKYAGIPEN